MLFGSTARGAARPDSDVDLLIDGLARRELRELEVAASRAVGREVVAVASTDASPLLRWEVARDGLLLLERPGAWVDFKRRAMIDWWDWGPTARALHQSLWKGAAARSARGQG